MVNTANSSRKDCNKQISTHCKNKQIKMKGAFCLTTILCLQCSWSMPFSPKMDNNIPEIPESEEEGHVLGQLVEDVDALKRKDEAQTHQIDILQKDVHGLAHTMEEQSLLLDKMMNAMEHEGLVLEDSQPGHLPVPPSNEMPYFPGMEPHAWEEEREPAFEHFEVPEDEDEPPPSPDIYDSMYDPRESFAYY